MGHAMRDTHTPEQQEERRGQTEGQRRRAPFDTSDLNNIPRTNADDPPYRNWWVVTDHDRR
jgi:hypothetical protein